jgi:DNA-binding IclR family transcriptional regulator
MMRAVQRILGIFESFTPDADSLTLQEIADRIELPKSTAFRIVQSLEQAGYLVRLENQQYCLSFRFTRLAGLVKSTLGIREISRPIMVELSEKTRESASLHTVDGRNRVCIDAVNAGSSLRTVTQPGEHIPLLGGSASKILMAYMPQDQLAPILTQIVKSTKRPKADVAKELERIRQQGYAISHGERGSPVLRVARRPQRAHPDAREGVHQAGGEGRSRHLAALWRHDRTAGALRLRAGRLRQLRSGRRPSRLRPGWKTP